MRHLGLAALGVILAAAGSASATETASATIAQTGTSPNAYTITLHNTGTTPIGTFWFGWIPGYDFLTSSPTVTGMPSGWVAPVTHEGGGDGYAIEWYNTGGSAIAAGASSNAFTFTSPDTLSQITSASTPWSFLGENAAVSYIYNGFPESDAGFSFVVTVPEPASIGLLAATGALILGRRRRNV